MSAPGGDPVQPENRQPRNRDRDRDLGTAEGLALILDDLRARGDRDDDSWTERVDVSAAVGRVLATPCDAAWPLPTAPLSIMDGYAVDSALLVAAWERGERDLSLITVGESAAGHPSKLELSAGTCMRIATGAVVPAGADAVVPREDARPDLADPDQPERVLFSAQALEQAAPGRWIRSRGSDVADGERLLDAGVCLGPGDAALLASEGHDRPLLRRRPVVAILSSGDELVAIGTRPGHGQIVSTNAMMLAAQIGEAGGVPLDLGAVADSPEALRAALERGACEADLIVCSGGISVGEHDLVLPALVALGLALRFRKLRLRPGRPTTYGLLPRSPSRPPLPVLALPGNPASTFVAFELFARPLIRALLGLPEARWHRPRRTLELAAAADGDPRREHYVRAGLDPDGRARPLTRQLSGALRSLAGVDVLLRVPEGRRSVAAGEHLEALILRE